MKPLDPTSPCGGPAATPEPNNEQSSALAQRLWQLLLELPQLEQELQTVQAVGEVGSLSAAACAGSTAGHTREQRERDTDATAALTSAAHLLATSVQQLGIARYEATSDAPAPPPSADLPWSFRVGDVDANGGNASIEVLHPLLGDIAIDVELSHGSARVIATVATEHGARILQEGQAVLAARLLRQGITLEALDVLVRRKRKDKRDARAPRKRPRKQDR